MDRAHRSGVRLTGVVAIILGLLPMAPAPANAETPGTREAVRISGSADGAGPEPGDRHHPDGGNGGVVEVHAGVDIDIGDGSDGFREESMDLEGPEYRFRQIAPGASGTPIVLSAGRDVVIRTQYLFDATIVARGGVKVTVFAGLGLRVDPEKTRPCRRGVPARHRVAFDVGGIPERCRRDGGWLLFETKQTGNLVAAGISANGADGGEAGKGGAGGSICLFANDPDPDPGGPSAPEVRIAHLGAKGGRGGTSPEEEFEEGGRGGAGGRIAVAGPVIGAGAIDISGGNGGAGTNAKPTPDSRPDGAGGGDGGDGGSLAIEAREVKPVPPDSIRAAGGCGGKGGDGRAPPPPPAMGRPGRGGDGGDGGHRGAIRISGFQVPKPARSAGGRKGEGGGGDPRYDAWDGRDGKEGSDVSRIPFLAPEAPELDEWTILVYSAGNDRRRSDPGDDPVRLSIAAGEDLAIAAMEEVDLADTPVNLLVQIDRSPGDAAGGGDRDPAGGPAGAEADAGSGSGAWRGFVVHRGEEAADPPGTFDSALERVPAGGPDPPGMAGPEALADAIRWARRAAPARRYLLVLSGNGEGANGLCHTAAGAPRPDGLDDRLTLDELRGALEGIDFPIDILFSPTSWSATVEALSEMGGRVALFVGAQTPATAGDVDYPAWLRSLRADPAMDARTLSRLLVENTARGAWSAVDVAGIEDIEAAVRKFVEEALLLPRRGAGWKALSAPAGSRDLGFDHRDIAVFLEVLRARLSGAPGCEALSRAAEAVEAAVSEAVVEKAGDESAGGLSAYLPENGISVADRYDDRLVFNLTTAWNEFLCRRPGAGPADEAGAYLWVGTGGKGPKATGVPEAGKDRPATIESMFGRPRDRHAYSFIAGKGQLLFARLRVDPRILDGSPSLDIHGPHGRSLAGGIEADAGGEASIDGLELLEDGEHVIAVLVDGDPGRWPVEPGARAYSLKLQFGAGSVLKPALLVSSVEAVPEEAPSPEGTAVSIELRNRGLMPLRIAAIGLREPGGPSARIGAPVPFSIPPRAARSIAIGLDREGDGVTAAPVLLILSDDPDSPRIEVPLAAP